MYFPQYSQFYLPEYSQFVREKVCVKTYFEKGNPITAHPISNEVMASMSQSWF